MKEVRGERRESAVLEIYSELSVLYCPIGVIAR
jgi:hypothetical protein